MIEFEACKSVAEDLYMKEVLIMAINPNKKYKFIDKEYFKVSQ